MSRVLNAEHLSEILVSSRTQQGKTQKYMAQAINKSLGTIKNWESGYSAPNILELYDWFEVLGVNAMRYMLDFLHPDVFDGLESTNTDEELNEALRKYAFENAPISERRKLAYCIFGNTGSSWSAQVDLLTTLNHLPLITRVHVAQLILDAYEIFVQRDDLIGTNHIMPDIENLEHAIEAAKNSVKNREQGYTNR